MSDDSTATCPACNYQQRADLVYCANCGTPIKGIPRQSSDADRLKFLGGELRILSVFFVSFVGFEKMMDKKFDKDIVTNLRDCMNEVDEIIKSYNGTSNQIIPDNRVFGIFGAPKAHKDDPVRVVRCAWQIKNWWRKKKSETPFLKDIDLTMGTNTGRAFFGYILEKYSFLTVIGDTINTAARITEICPPGEILISESTYERVSDFVDTEHIGERSVKGKRVKVDIYVLKNVKEEAPSVAPPKIPFFGRKAELERLIDSAEDMRKKKAHFCVISGQMGIGKTRLKEEFVQNLTNMRAFNCIETHCSTDVQTPYYPFVFLLKRYFNLNEFDSKDIVAHKIDDVIARLGLSALDAKGLKHLFITDLRRLPHNEMLAINEEIYVSCRNLIRCECQQNPLVLIFEEFNKADEMSKYLITYLVTELKNEPLLFLMVNVSGDFVSNISAKVEEINLAPLSFDETKELVIAILSDVDDTLAEFIYRSSGGNPLFVIETIRNTRRTKLIKRVSGRWMLEKEQRLPFLDDLYGVVMSTIDSLPSEYRLIVDYASVIGYSFNYRILQRLLERAHLQEQLTYLEREGYVVLSKEDRDPVYVFRHNLLKDAAYTVLPIRKRKEIHQFVAALLEELYADRLSDFYEHIGHHSLSCENYKKAAHYFKLAGDKAKNLYALEQAMQFYNTVLTIDKDTENQIDKEVVRDVFLNVTDIHELAGDISKMEKVALQGLESARKDNDLIGEVNFEERHAYALFLGNKLNEAEELLLEGIQKCDEHMPGILSVLYSDLGFLYQHKYEYEKSILQYNLSWNTAHAHEIKKGEIACLYNVSLLHRDLGNYEQALEYLEYCLKELIAADDMRWSLYFKYVIADIYNHIWDIGKAEDLLSECFTSADTIGNTEICMKSALDLAVINARDGDHKKARSYVDVVDKKLSFLIRENLLAEINLKKSMVYNSAQEPRRAKVFISSALAIAQKLRLKDIECSCRCMLSTLEPENALDHAHEALEIAEMLKLPPLIAAALFRLTELSIASNSNDKVRYFGRKALLVYDDMKLKLNEDHRSYYSQRPDYARLLEI